MFKRLRLGKHVINYIEDHFRHLKLIKKWEEEYLLF